MDTMVGEFLTLLLMAFALGMDSFSVGLGMGMFNLRLKQIAYIALTVGLFHIIMPLAGMIAGRFLSDQFGSYATYAGGLLLILLGIGMFISGLKGESESLVAPVGIGLFIFAISVSLDSLSVGLTLGIYGARTILTVSLFGLVATILTLFGLLLGRKVQGFLGAYSQVLGGSVLLAFGVKLFLPL
ncbi:manganese efflux pump MntP [Bacillus massiliigorillae]|uniref:manganese efflux pump MntP n=1 Tax=Bacillus massiliigorillae TaxID=1243664 RepID=UPI0003AAAE17|nr:manganese efflux pump MntP family protein [Bacillus massiliigorillae]